MVKWLARLCLSGIFIVGGYEAFMEPAPRTKRLPNLGMSESELAVKINGASMVLGGVAMGLGIFPKMAAFGLLSSLIPTTLAGHPFWKEPEATTLKQQRLQFAKNLGLIGGLLLVLADAKPKKETDE
jgi:uncharacterized membrane protein YphA (DoxX/SURF4 family)